MVFNFAAFDLCWGAMTSLLKFKKRDARAVDIKFFFHVFWHIILRAIKLMMGTENVKALLNPNLINSKIHTHTHTQSHTHARIMHACIIELNSPWVSGRKGEGKGGGDLQFHSSRVSHTRSGRTAPLRTRRLLHGGFIRSNELTQGKS